MTQHSSESGLPVLVVDAGTRGLGSLVEALQRQHVRVLVVNDTDSARSAIDALHLNVELVLPKVPGPVESRHLEWREQRMAAGIRAAARNKSMARRSR